jgi:hypothetical protein
MKKTKKVWILFVKENEYNQPPRAFVKLFWEKPTLEDLEEYGFKQAHFDAENLRKELRKPNNGGEAEYWVETFQE